MYVGMYKHYFIYIILKSPDKNKVSLYGLFIVVLLYRTNYGHFKRLSIVIVIVIVIVSVVGLVSKFGSFKVLSVSVRAVQNSTGLYMECGSVCKYVTECVCIVYVPKSVSLRPIGN